MAKFDLPKSHTMAKLILTTLLLSAAIKEQKSGSGYNLLALFRPLEICLTISPGISIYRVEKGRRGRFH